jgi:hypothetical protein
MHTHNRIIRNPDRHIIRSKLTQALPAATARRHRISSHPAHSNSQDTAPPGQDQMGNRGRLSALALRISRILDIAARVQAPMLIQQRRAHQKLGIRRIGPLSRSASRLHQGVHHLVINSSHDQRSFTYGMPSAAGARERPMNPASSTTVST